ncbi:hypothetical protein KP001_09030 [Geomonas subterranea]|uniref:Uncharacterized protein n=1 Tax=Geomonas subterranea TaxID=2847989 RepID=A0ABX8LNX1_9BACT|nr:hypothetical protein [Geomonas subterranea]QXE92641.1 hypothetical protein KP001_09030 [Geomonas subterranea]QXM09260.1 hypothetical protein KP002_20245 [Geomonas subterranea]
MLAEIGMPAGDFVRLKEEFSAENLPDWSASEVCYGSLAYCCMRSNGCPGRDEALRRVYPGMQWEDVLREYFSRKKRLAEAILTAAKGDKSE